MGIRIAVPAAGPNPGRTPIRVPRTQPIRANIRLIGRVATENPCIQYCKASKTSSSNPEDADGQRQFQPVVKNVKNAETADDRQNGDNHPVSDSQKYRKEEEE